MKQKALTYEPIQHRQYGLPHGASNPMQAAMLNQKHMAEQQNKLITGGRKRTKQTKRKNRKTKQKRRKTCKCMCPACRRCKYRKSSRRTRRSYKGGTKGPIHVPHFIEPSNPVSPDGANTQSKNLNATYVQGKANAQYDQLYNAPPRSVSSF